MLGILCVATSMNLFPCVNLTKLCSQALPNMVVEGKSDLPKIVNISNHPSMNIKAPVKELFTKAAYVKLFS